MSDLIRDRIAAIIGEPFGPGSAQRAAKKVLHEFNVGHRSEETIEDRGGYFICGSGPGECGARPSDNPNWLRNHAANALALADYIELVEREQNTRNKRRDEVAGEFSAVKTYGGQLPYTQKLIDRIIDLEQNLGARS